MKVITTESVPIKVWAGHVEADPLRQAYNLANFPFAHHHVALMPDVHYGYGMPIGGVLATKGVVIPNAVGVDIGCGMCAAQTALPATVDLKDVVDLIRQRIPTGFKKHSSPQNMDLMPEPSPFMEVALEQFDNARLSLGTLGGGNHFIEIQTDGTNLWVMIHSGSRNLGKQVADHYNKKAIELNARWYSGVPPNWRLAFLPLMGMDSIAYLDEMNYCVKFAKANRQTMMREVLQALYEVYGHFLCDSWIDIAHNYAAQERHYGENVVVHRKGAVRARKDEIGIIPGSQGTSSFITRGLGNRESFESCSHGAGRRMGRKQAQRELSLEVEQARLKGIIHSVRGEKDLDEAPGAYKDIHQVMENQADLVEIVTELHPLAVVKG
jgi:tRNA-splicing ligase RtcB